MSLVEVFARICVRASIEQSLLDTPLARVAGWSRQVTRREQAALLLVLQQTPNSRRIMRKFG